MIEKVKRGILVTRFHYINGLIDTRNSVLTGMTRDGTFLIEDGEIKHGIKNLRFTDSIMRTFKSTVAISKETHRVPSWWSAVGCMTVPTIHLSSFKFSGKTDF
jgi:predicted Zn-dependent protease